MDAGALTTFLAPALGFLMGVSDDVSERATGSLGAAIWSQASRLWSRLGPSVEADPAARDAAEQLRDAPEDLEARAALAFRLRRILAEDPELASALDSDWEAARGQTTAVAAAERSVALAGRNVGNVIVTGDRGEPPPT